MRAQCRAATALKSGYPFLLAIFTMAAAYSIPALQAQRVPVHDSAIHSNQPSTGATLHPAAASGFKLGMLTLHAQNQALSTVLRQITKLTGVPISGTESLPDKQISIDLEQFRLDEALRQILNGYDLFFLYGADQSELGASLLKAVWVYPANRGQGLAPLPSNAWETQTQDMQRMLSESDPSVRARAIDTIIRRAGRESAEAVQAVLKDEDENVRITALNRALNSGVEIPQEVLINLALYDSSANIRYLALQALPIDPKMRWVAERALQDSSIYVSRAAQGIVGELDTAASTSN